MVKIFYINLIYMSIYNLLQGNSDVYYKIQADDIFITKDNNQLIFQPTEETKYITFDIAPTQQFTFWHFPDPLTQDVYTCYGDLPQSSTGDVTKFLNQRGQFVTVSSGGLPPNAPGYLLNDGIGGLS